MADFWNEAIYKFRHSILATFSTFIVFLSGSIIFTMHRKTQEPKGDFIFNKVGLRRLQEYFGSRSAGVGSIPPREQQLLLTGPPPTKETVGHSRRKVRSGKRASLVDTPAEIIENIVSNLVPADKVTVICLALTNRYLYSIIPSIVNSTIPRFYSNPNNCDVCQGKKVAVLQRARRAVHHVRCNCQSRDDFRDDVLMLARYGLDASFHFHREWEVLLRRLRKNGWVVRRGISGSGG